MNFTPVSLRLWNFLVFAFFLTLIFGANYILLKELIGVPEDFARTGAYVVTAALGMKLETDF